MEATEERLRRIGAHVTLREPDYVDCFVVESPGAGRHSAEAWARAVLERSPLARRNARRLWRLLGLRLGPKGSASHVAGWLVAATEEDWVRIETSSWYLSAQAVCLVDGDAVSLSLSLRYRRPIVGALVWRFVEGPHRSAVPVMLRQAVTEMVGASKA
jgi:hypothetical protein